ncbi:MAG TPA: protein phosphatase 2C domain-containing protein [Bryobacteraceae bacterium]|nr:protein phosphatase 2C domain-containing protein [Bryobacteraceae bacterium]
MVKSTIRSAGASDPGKVRRNNEDSFLMDTDRGIFLVVDGIGGQAAGEKAAEIAVGRIRARLERQTGTAEQRVREAITVANNEILHAAQGNPAWQGMACVLTLAVLENGSAVVGHVGDSRLYQVRRGEIRKITRDHSPVGEREDSQELSEAEAMRHPRRNEVFRDVGSEEHAPDDPDFIDVERIAFEPNSALVLCTDGLSDLVASADIRRIVERNAGHPDASVRELIEAANRAGGKDNVTVLVIEGEQFTAPAIPEVATSAAPRRRGGAGAAWFIAGLLVAAAAAGIFRSTWVPAPVVIRPQTLAVGQNERLTSIASALEAAHAGDVIEVAPGDYHEQVKLKSGVTVRSRVPREARLLGTAVSAGAAVVAEGVRNARISGFLIQGDAQAPVAEGIVLVDSVVEVDGMEIAGTGTGIEIRGGESPTLEGNTIRDSSGDGIAISGPSKPWISHNWLRMNKGVGLAARDGARPSLVGNVFDKQKVELPADISMDTVRSQNIFVGQTAAPVSRRAGHE